MAFDLEEFFDTPRALMLLTLVVLGSAFPFVSRAYFVDDYYHVSMAKGILEHPLRPYDFRSADAGHNNKAWEEHEAPRMVNPPLFHYYLAGVIKVWGEETRKLRTAILLFPLLSVFAMYFLGRRFTEHPLKAALLAAVTPAFWLTSYALLIDSAMLALMLLGLLQFFRACETRSVAQALGAGLLMGLCFLTKYIGVLGLFLFILWQAQSPELRRWRGGYAAYVGFLLVFLVWGIWGIATYGQMHVLATFHRGFHATHYAGLLSLLLWATGLYFYLEETKWPVRPAFLCWITALVLVIFGFLEQPQLQLWLERYYVDKLIVVGSFVSGSFIFPLASVVIAWDVRKRVLGILFALLLVFAWVFTRWGGFTSGQSFLLAGLIVGTLGFLLLVAATHDPMRDSTDRFLMSWLVVGMLELIVVMPWTAGRYYLLILPTAVWLFARLLERTRERPFWPITTAFTALAGITLAYVDYIQADAIVRLAQTLEGRRGQLEAIAPPSKTNWYYLGDTFSGSEPYLAPLGWKNAFPSDPLEKGDLFLKPFYRLSSWWKVPHPERFKPIFVVEMKGNPPVRVMDIPDGAGFYGSCWGPLPFVFTKHPVERFELYQVQ